MVRSFKTLCELADFDASLSIPFTPTELPTEEVSHQIESASVIKDKPGYTININIQLALPSDATKETFDAFFESMKKYLG